MIHGVCVFYASIVLLPHSRCLSSYASSVTSTNGDPMCYARGFRYLPRTRRQGAELSSIGVAMPLMPFQSLFAYDVEALVPLSPGAANASQTPQKLSGNKDVQFFTVGNIGDRTLVIYMKKKNVGDF